MSSVVADCCHWDHRAQSTLSFLGKVRAVLAVSLQEFEKLGLSSHEE